MSKAARRRGGLFAAIARIDDGNIIRAAFFAMLLGTAGVLYVDYQELTGQDLAKLLLPAVPILPAFDPDSLTPPSGPAVTSDPALLQSPLTVTLGAGGALLLNGTIDPGAFARVEAELTAKREYVKVVVLDSPGGSVDDAIRIGTLLHVEGLATEVKAGALCASSCPLVLAGGVVRKASEQAAIGVHQIYAALPAGQRPTGLQAGDAMASAQRTTAAITRYLEITGVDPAVWLHALETPPDRLYYLTPEELVKYRLATEMVGAASVETLPAVPQASPGP